jgi:hypothetical protein
MPSSLLEELRRPSPSQLLPDRIRRPHRQRRKKEFARLTARIAALEAQLAAIALLQVAPSLIPEGARAVSEPPEQLVPPREGPITDSRRPDPVVLEEKAQAAEARHRALAEGFRRHAFAMNLMASRGFSARRWVSPYWNASAYRSGF